MSDLDTERSEPGTAAKAVGRLLSARFVLAAVALALLAVSQFAGGLPLAVVAWLLVCVVAAFAPGRTIGERAAREGATARAAAGSLTVEQLAAAVPDPIIIFDADGALVHANRAATAAFSPLLPGTSLVLKFRAPEMQDLIGRVLADGRPASIDYPERVPLERWFRVAASPVGDGGGLFVMVFKDQSEARRIDRMRADFVANASHELRTPLASVAGFIETLRGPARSDEKARERFLEIMQNQTARMARLIDDLLSLSRLDMKPFLNASDAVDLKPLIGGVVDALKPLAAESGVTIETVFGDSAAVVSGSRDELIQVFDNLLENACKYGRDGGRVVVYIEHVAGGIDVAVRDFGPGIAEEHIPRLTERFYRIDAEASRGQKGTGLGLAIVKHILTRHNARLTIRSKPGEGSTFTAHFPPN